MDEFRFLKWSVYKNTKDLVKEVYKTTDKFPQRFNYELGSQINKFVISVTLNIVEGSGKNLDKELNRFFSIASILFKKEQQDLI